jgi:hypothetical protein
MGSVPGLGGVLSGSSASGTGRITSGSSSCPSLDIHTDSDYSDDDGGVTEDFSLSNSSRTPPLQCIVSWLDGFLCGFQAWPGKKLLEVLVVTNDVT